MELERYKHIQISSYNDLASQASEDKAIREIQIGIINKHNMAERGMRYTELWRYDAEAKTLVDDQWPAGLLGGGVMSRRGRSIHRAIRPAWPTARSSLALARSRLPPAQPATIAARCLPVTDVRES